jgi:hypothetical protein
MVRMLMQSGADPHATTAGIYALRDAASPLAIALEREYEEIVAIIGEEERRRNAGRASEEEGVAELRHALEACDDEALAELLSRRPDLASSPIADSRWTLLHLASAFLLPRAAARLLDLGADVNSHAPDGWTPLDVAGSGGGLTHYPGLHRNPKESAEAMGMIHLLQQRGATLTARSAVILGDEASLRRIAAEENLITPRDDRGWLLRLAVDCNQHGMLRLLLDLGLDPDARVRVEESDQLTFTWGMPLYQCARYGKHAMARCCSRAAPIRMARCMRAARPCQKLSDSAMRR